jgi:hypothetical protein
MSYIGVHVFNPWNPLSYAALWNPATYYSRPSIFPPQAAVPAGTPIDIKPGSSDPGISIVGGKDSVTLRGVSEGFKVVKDLSGYTKYEVGRGVSFTLDINKAPTEDIFGKTDFTAKNHRIFGIDTSKGWSAAKCAQLLADKVNAYDDFRASVTTHKDGSATINFRRY